MAVASPRWPTRWRNLRPSMLASSPTRTRIGSGRRWWREPDLVGGFNRLDSTILKAGGGKVIAKEGADGLLGLAIEHPDYPKGLGIVIKLAHGWDSQAMWYLTRATLGVLGVDLRNPYPLHRQKAFVVPGVVPDALIDALDSIPTWDEWDPDTDRWFYDVKI